MSQKPSWKSLDIDFTKMTGDDFGRMLNSDTEVSRAFRNKPIIIFHDGHRGSAGGYSKKASVFYMDPSFAARIERSEDSKPPKLAELLLLLLPIRQREHLLGDLEEEFRTIILPRHGRRLACFLFYWQVIIEMARAVITGLSGVALGWIFSKFTK